jgi:hypothetical protein
MKRLGLFLLIALVACNMVGLPHLPIEQNDYVIFNTEQAEAQYLAPFIPTGAVDSYWNISDMQVRQVNAALLTYLEENDETELLENFEDYQQQFFGYVVDGEQMIYGNYFCMEFEDWQTEFVFVLDGGDCFFQAIYSVASDEIISLSINGDA